jgi:propanediol utilization protein
MPGFFQCIHHILVSTVVIGLLLSGRLFLTFRLKVPGNFLSCDAIQTAVDRVTIAQGNMKGPLLKETTMEVKTNKGRIKGLSFECRVE